MEINNASNEDVVRFLAGRANEHGLLSLSDEVLITTKPGELDRIGASVDRIDGEREWVKLKAIYVLKNRGGTSVSAVHARRSGPSLDRHEFDLLGRGIRCE